MRFSASRSAAWHEPSSGQDLASGERAAAYGRTVTERSERNARLTGSTAVILFCLLALEGVTILFIRPLLSVHEFVGMMLVPPVLLKLASTGWRFARYYRRDPDFVVAGPPKLLLRMTAPFLVLATIGVFATGVTMLALGPRSQGLIGLHTASFVVWFGAMVVHVLGHVLRVPGLARVSARGQRLLVAGAVVAGVVVAGATVPLIHPWTHWAAHQRDDRAARPLRE